LEKYYSIVLSNFCSSSSPAEAIDENKMLVLALQFSRCDVTLAEPVTQYGASRLDAAAS
jgi:hypothetical protein